MIYFSIAFLSPKFYLFNFIFYLLPFTFYLLPSTFYLLPYALCLPPFATLYLLPFAYYLYFGARLYKYHASMAKKTLGNQAAITGSKLPFIANTEENLPTRI